MKVSYVDAMDYVASITTDDSLADQYLKWHLSDDEDDFIPEIDYDLARECELSLMIDEFEQGSVE